MFLDSSKSKERRKQDFVQNIKKRLPLQSREQDRWVWCHILQDKKKTASHGAVFVYILQEGFLAKRFLTDTTSFNGGSCATPSFAPFLVSIGINNISARITYIFADDNACIVTTFSKRINKVSNKYNYISSNNNNCYPEKNISEYPREKFFTINKFALGQNMIKIFKYQANKSWHQAHRESNPNRHPQAWERIKNSGFYAISYSIKCFFHFLSPSTKNQRANLTYYTITHINKKRHP